MTTRVVIIALLFSLALIRIVHIEADFPPGINWSGDLYTDEGIYTSAATAYYITGNWYRTNDYNPAISQPVGHILHALVFTIFGSSLFSARLTIVFCFALILLLFYLLTTRFLNPTAAYLVVALLATNFFLFAFSRLAILDIIMCTFILLGLSIALLSTKMRVTTLLLSACCLTLATLTKYSAIVGLAPLAYIIWVRTAAQPSKIRLLKVATPLILCGLLVMSYLAWARITFPGDFQTYQDVLSQRSEQSLLGLLFNPLTLVRDAIKHDPLVALSAFILIPTALVTISRFRTSMLVQSLIVWVVSYYLLLCLLNYHPPRYFLMLAIPTIALLGMAIYSLYQSHRSPWRRPLALLLTVTVLGINLYRMTNYLAHPEYTYLNMAREVAAIATCEATGTPPLIIAHSAASLNLASGIAYVNADFGSTPLEQRIKSYSPTHYVVRGNDDSDKKDVAGALQAWYILQPVKTFDVFRNYIDEEQIHLYRLLPK